MKRSSIIFLALMFLTAASAFSQAKPTPTPEKLKLERTGKFDGNVAFPEVEGWTRSEKQQYPTPDLGYSYTYQSPQARVTVIVYNAGLKKIPNELTGPVAEQMQNARSDVKAIVKQGSYDSATEGKVETVFVGGAKGKVKSLHTEFTITANGNELDSEIYLFPYNDHFVKIRATRQKSAGGKRPDLLALFEEIDTLFSR